MTQWMVAHQAHLSMISNFLMNLLLSSIMVVPIYIFTNSAREFLFFTSLPELVIPCLFDSSHSNVSNQSILKEISPKYSLEGLMLKLKLQILWPSDAKNWLVWKDPDAGKDWRQEEKGMTEDETVGWHHRLNRHEFDDGQGVGDGQGGLACCSPWSGKDTTEQLN